MLTSLPSGLAQSYYFIVITGVSVIARRRGKSPMCRGLVGPAVQRWPCVRPWGWGAVRLQQRVPVHRGATSPQLPRGPSKPRRGISKGTGEEGGATHAETLCHTEARSGTHILGCISQLAFFFLLKAVLTHCKSSGTQRQAKRKRKSGVISVPTVTLAMCPVVFSCGYLLFQLIFYFFSLTTWVMAFMAGRRLWKISPLQTQTVTKADVQHGGAGLKPGARQAWSLASPCARSVLLPHILNFLMRTFSREEVNYFHITGLLNR